MPTSSGDVYDKKSKRQWNSPASRDDDDDDDGFPELYVLVSG